MAASPSSPTGDEPEPAPPRSRVNWMMTGGVALLVLAVSLIGGNDTSSTVTTRPAAPAQVSASAPPAGQPGQPTGLRLPRSKPERLLIPKISVDAPFTELSIGSSGHLDPPPAADTNLVGWYAGGASPGEAGTAIIAGHVDTATSAAVFARLSELRKGDTFSVRRADGRTAAFVVDSTETYPKNDFPDQRVYGDTGQAQVRLITCAGDYDHAAKDYEDNLVVFAHLV